MTWSTSTASTVHLGPRIMHMWSSRCRIMARVRRHERVLVRAELAVRGVRCQPTLSLWWSSQYRAGSDEVDALRVPTLPGCAELTAAKLISEAANVDRFPNESAFARYGGLAPVPEWSGSTNGRLRVCRSGNRQINTAIHRIAVVQLRLDCAGRDYYQRRRAEGDSGATAVRCLKRRLCRVVFNRLRADYARRPRLAT